MLKQELISLLSHQDIFGELRSYKKQSYVWQMVQNAVFHHSGDLSERYEMVIQTFRSLVQLPPVLHPQKTQDVAIPVEPDFERMVFPHVVDHILVLALFIEVRYLIANWVTAFGRAETTQEQDFLHRELERVLIERQHYRAQYPDSLTSSLESLDFLLCLNVLSLISPTYDWITPIQTKRVPYSMFSFQTSWPLTLNESWVLKIIQRSTAVEQLGERLLGLAELSSPVKQFVADSIFMSACKRFDLPNYADGLTLDPKLMAAEKSRIRNQFIAQVEKKIGDTTKKPSGIRQLIVQLKGFCEDWVQNYQLRIPDFSNSLAQHTVHYLHAIWEASARNAPIIDVEDYHDTFFSIQEVADKLEVTPRTVAKYIKTKKLKQSLRGTRKGVCKSDLEDFLGKK